MGDGKLCADVDDEEHDSDTDLFTLKRGQVQTLPLNLRRPTARWRWGKPRVDQQCSAPLACGALMTPATISRLVTPTTSRRQWLDKSRCFQAVKERKYSHSGSPHVHKHNININISTNINLKVDDPKPTGHGPPPPPEGRIVSFPPLPRVRRGGPKRPERREGRPTVHQRRGP